MAPGPAERNQALIARDRNRNPTPRRNQKPEQGTYTLFAARRPAVPWAPGGPAPWACSTWRPASTVPFHRAGRRKVNQTISAVTGLFLRLVVPQFGEHQEGPLRHGLT
jgi:hypothetical protein